MPVRISINFSGVSTDQNAPTNSAQLENNVNTVNNAGNNDNQQVRESKSRTTALTVGKLIAYQTISYSLSNVGQWTGNQQAQQSINNIQEVVGIGAIAMSNPLLALGTSGFKLATTAIDEGIRRRKESVVLAQARARAGYTTDNVANYRRR